MTTTKNLPETPAGWILGTDCGYKSHTGFVKDGTSRRMHWSLTPSATGWTLALIENQVAISTRAFPTVEEAVSYVG